MLGWSKGTIRAKYKVLQSMSSKGNCWDNALAEIFFKTLKSAMINHTIYHALDQEKMDVFEFIGYLKSLPK